MRKSFPFPAVLCVCLSFLSIAFPGALRAGAAPSRAMTPIRAVVLPYISFAPFFIAKDEGYFEKQGLDVEFVRMVQASAAVSEVARGNIDVTTAGTRIGLFNAMARGADIRFVADKGTFLREEGVSNGFVVRKDLLDAAGRPDWNRIKGQKVSVDATSFWGFLFERYLAKNGLRMQDFVVEDLPVTAIPAGFAQKNLAMAHLSEPWLSKVVRAGDAVLAASDASLAPSAHFAAICFGPSLLKKNPEAGVRFMVAYLMGVRQYNKGKTPRNIAILVRNTELDEETVKASAWSAMRGDGMMDPSGFVEFQRWARGKNLLDKVMLPSEIWDPSFARRANGILGEARP